MCACPEKRRRVCAFTFTPSDSKRWVPRPTLVALARPILATIYSFLDMASVLRFAATARRPREACKASPSAWPKRLHFGTLFHSDGQLPTGQVLRQISQTIGHLDVIDTDLQAPLTTTTCREQAMLWKEKEYQDASASAISAIDPAVMAQGFVSLLIHCRPTRLVLHKTVHRMLDKVAKHQWSQLLRSVEDLDVSEIQNSKAFAPPHATALEWITWEHMLLGMTASTSKLTRLNISDNYFTSSQLLSKWLPTLPQSLTDLDVRQCTVAAQYGHIIPLPSNLTRLACSPTLWQFGEPPAALRTLIAHLTPMNRLPTFQPMSLRTVRSTLTELAIVGSGFWSTPGCMMAHHIMQELRSAPITSFVGCLCICKHASGATPLPPWPLVKLNLHCLAHCRIHEGGNAKPASLADLADAYSATLTHLELYTVIPSSPLIEWQDVLRFSHLKHLSLAWPDGVSSTSSSLDSSNECKPPLLETLAVSIYRAASPILPDQHLLSMLQPFQSSLAGLSIRVFETRLSPATVLQLKSLLSRLKTLEVSPCQIDSPECIQALAEWRLPDLNVVFDPQSHVCEMLAERGIEFRQVTPETIRNSSS